MNQSNTKNKVSKWSKQWIEKRLKSYLQSELNTEMIREDIKRAKYVGIKKHDFKKIIINLPSNENIERFQIILKILKEMELI